MNEISFTTGDRQKDAKLAGI